MSWQRERHMMRDDGDTEVIVAFSIIHPGETGNGWDDPGSGPEIEIIEARIAGVGSLVELTEQELERMEAELCADPDLCDFLDDQPGDY